MSNLSFNAATFFPTVFPPRGITVADVNGDSKSDLLVVVGGGIDADVAVLLGNGNGTFQPPSFFPVGIAPLEIVAADFNGDGNIDVAVTNVGSNDVSVLLSNGDGTFGAAVNYPTFGYSPHGIVAVDVNGDGNTDLVTANHGSNDVSILLGNGDGTFSSPITIGVGNRPWEITAADFNGDGNMDLAVTNRDSNNVGILLGNGDGTFQLMVPYSTGVDSFPRGILSRDLNGDGKLDLAVANVLLNNVAVLLGNGDGSFQEAKFYGIGTATAPWSIVSGDFDEDGKLDLATVNRGSGNIGILLGNGDGTFNAAQLFAVGNLPWGITTADFNGDGKLDLVSTDEGANNVAVLINDSNVIIRGILFNEMEEILKIDIEEQY